MSTLSASGTIYATRLSSSANKIIHLRVAIARDQRPARGNRSDTIHRWHVYNGGLCKRIRAVVLIRADGTTFRRRKGVFLLSITSNKQSPTQIGKSTEQSKAVAQKVDLQLILPFSAHYNNLPSILIHMNVYYS